ncbi:phenylacetate-CoA ligase [Clostridium cavendishii DSM 21758]|uniref:Phenylacetate-CoA ligase n=1 Tax=Clostridium cavendishii DSM 21758 TaxID=1121302 RepID=A0A1M6ULF8_9CLOT|nr:AMP-binding protein [Clostridium cavendishii]SHK70016.1 phenylacetate-CoA ligase [Clostridium cavendishii DSM 21758]
MSKKYWNEEIETIDREKLEEYQLKNLKEQIKFAYNNSAYYKKSFNDVGVTSEDIQALEDIRKFPFINKSIVRKRQQSKPLLGDLVAVEEERVVFVSSSSGSTGIPTVSPFTKKDFDEFQNIESRLFWGTGMRPNDRYVHALNFSLFVGGPDVIGAQNLGALCIWAGTLPSDRLLFILKEYKPTIIWTTPSYAWYLGETARQKGINIREELAIKKIIVAGEPGGSIEATKNAIEDLWGAEVYDFYGISDIFGACAGVCEYKNGLHVAEDQLLVEVINTDTLEPVGPGERGELILTTLRKEARPMIRFRTGDIVTYTDEKCVCGRTHKRINIIGRLDDMFISSGVNVFPSDIEYIVRNIEGLTGEYRITLFTKNHMTKFSLEVEVNENIKKTIREIQDTVSSEIKAHIGVKPTEINVLISGELPRATHKAKRVIDLRR